MKNVMIVFAIFFGFGCASIHTQHKAKVLKGEENKEMVISARQTNSFEDAFAAVTVNFENKGQKWIRIHKVEALIGDDIADKVSVVMGNDLVDWSSAMTQKIQLERHNSEVTQALILGGAGVATAAAGHKSPQIASAGLVVIGGLESWVVVDMINYQKEALENPETVPRNHLYHPFSIPPGLFLRRWIVFNVPSHFRVRKLPLKITFVDGKESIVVIDLKKMDS